MMKPRVRDPIVTFNVMAHLKMSGISGPRWLAFEITFINYERKGFKFHFGQYLSVISSGFRVALDMCCECVQELSVNLHECSKCVRPSYNYGEGGTNCKADGDNSEVPSEVNDFQEDSSNKVLIKYAQFL
jgi:hypothetical protein